ncbi:hypothetical protein AAG570_002295 [Ranatra chinensis]|uniref:Immunoglobulin-binding protein 1 n=1 Tax=Ranatra chinensis TaxID=642074 RepID=A0ABD0YPX9_9HEMI
MASGSNDDTKLLDLFDEGYALFESVSHCDEPTNSVCIQSKIKQAMRMLEDCTRLTSMAGVFSSNESLEEIPSENLRLLLLPALLGTLALKLTVPNRMEVVETSDVYFRDFIQRCNDYGISDIHLEPPVEPDPEEVERSMANVRSSFDLASAARGRASKIERYLKEKMLEDELKMLAPLVRAGEQVDDEVKRDYYVKLIKSYATKAEEEIDCLQSEKRILVHIKNQAKKDESLTGVEEKRRRPNTAPPPKPLKPVIITKDELQKAVFGVGYPSLPTMTVQEFYDKRVKDGTFPDPNKSSTSKAGGGGQVKDRDEEEEAERDRLEEQDDEETLNRQRQMDDYKDDHKRGWGNRYNRS